jgi:hypothetical protein
MDLLDLDGSRGNWEQEMIRELPDRYTFLDGLETVFEQNWFELGAYRPHRFAPTLYQTKDIQEGFVFHHGQVVSGINLKDGNSNWNSSAGIDTTGYFAHGVGFNGSLKDDVDSLYGYDRTLDGVLVPCNGTNASINDLVSASDVSIERVLANGNVAQSSDVGSTVAITRGASQAPLGVVSQIMRETSGANLSYRLWTQAWSVVRYGILNIPYVLSNANTIANPVLSDSGYAAVHPKHQFMLVMDPALMKHEAAIRVDANGKLILTSDTTTYTQRFGKIMSWTNVTHPLIGQKVDGFPGMESQGTTNTGGLTRRLFTFVRSIRAANGQTTAIKDIVADVDAGTYGMVKVIFNTMTV